MPTNYKNVNETWPENPPVPSPQEALAGAKRLVRLALTLGPEDGAPWRKKFGGEFKLTSGRRYTYPRRGVFYVNPNQRSFCFGGWLSICHDIAHWAGQRLYPTAKPHDHRTAFIERKLAEHVVKSGWLDGKLKRRPKEKPPVDKVAERAARIDAGIKRWDSKRRRAENALRKLKRQQKRLQKQAAPKGAAFLLALPAWI